MDIFLPGGALVPRGVDLSKWSVVACDQYTSEPEYWRGLARYVGDAPSALRLIIPEVYLNESGLEQRVSELHAEMERYLNDGFLQDAGDCYILVERTLSDGTVRYGLLGRLDLEAYDYSVGSRSLVRATEGTVPERIPPRASVRRGAALELPHILLLCDDAECTVVEPALGCACSENLLYDVSLYGGGGRVRGFAVSGAAAQGVKRALAAITENAQKQSGVAIAVGDGNHSLAAAKACCNGDARSRYALAELCNLHSPSITFEPIHRVLSGIDAEKLRSYVCGAVGADCETICTDSGAFLLKTASGESLHHVPKDRLPTAEVQRIIDAYLCENCGEVDYVHGDDVAKALGSAPNSAAFLLPPIDKFCLFPTIVSDGALPRKTFSMGHAHDKRYYIECRKIR